ncbi:MAG: ChaN family lipoprotein [Pseudohongiellaceae bacterium]
MSSELTRIMTGGFLAACSVIGGITQANAQTVPGITEWQTSLYADHPLTGRIWLSETAEFISIDDLLAAIGSGSYLLLGEKHDNPDHHLLQQQLVEYLIRQDRLESLSLEMLDSGQSGLLTAMTGQEMTDLDSLQTYLQWDAAGWNWEFYAPLIQAARLAGIPVRSANISETAMREVYAQTADPLPNDILDEAAMQQLNEEIDSSHCQLLPASQFPAMVRVQQARDYSMAHSLADDAPVAPGKLRVLIAGNFHVRSDLGVPRYLAYLNPELEESQTVSLAILEVDGESVDPNDYLQAFSAKVPYDFIWFTPALTDEDYCATLQDR